MPQENHFCRRPSHRFIRRARSAVSDAGRALVSSPPSTAIGSIVGRCAPAHAVYEVVSNDIGTSQTLLGKFLRRAAMVEGEHRFWGREGMGEGVWGHLSDNYYSIAYDPTLDLLKSVPWDEGEDVMDAFLSNKISIYDVAKDQLMQHITDRCQEDCGHFFEALGVARELDVECTKAHIQVRNGRCQLSTAAEQSSVSSGITLVKLVSARRRLQNLQDLISCRVKLLQGKEDHLLTLVAKSQFEDAIDVANEVRVNLKDREFNLTHLACLEPMRLRASSAFLMIYESIGTCLERMCQSTFCSKEYSALLKSRISLDWHLREFSTDNVDLNKNIPCSATVAVRILDFHKMRVNNSYLTLLRTVLGDKLTRKNDFIDNLKDYELSELLARVDRKDISGIYYRLCVSIYEIVHQYFLFLQWHNNPFEKNSDNDFLHHIGIHHVVGSPTVISPEGENDDGKIQKGWYFFLNKQIASIGRGLHFGRDSLWSQCENVLTSLISSCLQWGGCNSTCMEKHNNRRFNIVDLVNILDMCEMIVVLGEEFCGASCHNLQARLIDLTKNFYKNMHSEAVGIIREMIVNETWNFIPSDHIAKKYLAKKKNSIEAFTQFFQVFLTSQCSRRNVFPDKVLNNFKSDGNPFIYNFCELASNLGKEEAQQEEDLCTSKTFYVDKELDVNMEKSQSLHLKNSSQNITQDQVHFKTDDIEGRPSKISPPHIRKPSDEFWNDYNREEAGTCFCAATYTLVNGLARWTSKYLQAMALLPSIRNDLSIGITRLFDLYFMSVLRLASGSKGVLVCSRLKQLGEMLFGSLKLIGDDFSHFIFCLFFSSFF